MGFVTTNISWENSFTRDDPKNFDNVPNFAAEQFVRQKLAPCFQHIPSSKKMKKRTRGENSRVCYLRTFHGTVPDRTPFCMDHLYYE